MLQGWNQERVGQLAPDPASLKAGQGLAQVRKWVQLGRDDRVVWGECQGSGSKPYQTQFDLSDATSKCSCPSRKFPCKHAIGLMLILSSSPNDIANQSPPAWVEEWFGARADRVKKKQEKAEAPTKPVDEEAATARREKRLTRIREGLAALKIWSEDLLRGGIATLPSKGYAFFDEPARRMIDAPAPGVARRLQRLGEIAAGGAGWNGPFVQELASLHLLIRAFDKIDALPESTREDVLATLGIPPKSEDAASLLPVRDTWQILAQEIESQDRLRVQRTWLLGAQTKRPALILAFAHGTAPLDSSLSPGMCFEGEIGYFLGNGIRAAVKERGELHPIPRIFGFASLDELTNAAGDYFARQPWLEELAAPLQNVVPHRTDGGWILIDGELRAMPAIFSEQAGWIAMAMSGGNPLDLVAGYDGRRLRPLALWAEGEYVSLAPAAVQGG
jgi:hypothetical protein